MSNLTEINEQLNQLPQEQRAALVSLIDIKTESDMDKVLNRLDAMESKFDAKFDAIDSKFDAIESKISNLQWFMAAILGFIALSTKLNLF